MAYHFASDRGTGLPVRTILLLSLLILCGAAQAAPEYAPQHQAQLVQGAFDSSSDRKSLQRALAKAFGREVRISAENLAAGDGAPGDQFGFSVALSGDTALVGAFVDDTPAGAGAGSVYVFTRSGMAWLLQAKLTAGDGAANDRFGVSVALSGDTALVGAPGDDTPAGANAGSAYVFTRSGTLWSQQQRLNADDGAANDGFGSSVALSGDTALMGAPFDNTSAGADAGSAYVFTRSGSLWSQQQRLEAGDGAADAEFGSSVALSGDTALVGALFDDTSTGADTGSAYVFVRGAIWFQQAKLTAGDGAVNDQFGYSVALSGDTALIGAYGDDGAVTGNLDVGSAYLYTDNPIIFNDGFESVP